MSQSGDSAGWRAADHPFTTADCSRPLIAISSLASALAGLVPPACKPYPLPTDYSAAQSICILGFYFIGCYLVLLLLITPINFTPWHFILPISFMMLSCSKILSLMSFLAYCQIILLDHQLYEKYCFLSSSPCYNIMSNIWHV